MSSRNTYLPFIQSATTHSSVVPQKELNIHQWMIIPPKIESLERDVPRCPEEEVCFRITIQK